MRRSRARSHENRVFGRERLVFCTIRKLESTWREQEGANSDNERYTHGSQLILGPPGFVVAPAVGLYHVMRVLVRYQYPRDSAALRVNGRVAGGSGGCSDGLSKVRQLTSNQGGFSRGNTVEYQRFSPTCYAGSATPTAWSPPSSRSNRGVPKRPSLIPTLPNLTAGLSIEQGEASYPPYLAVLYQRACFTIVLRAPLATFHHPLQCVTQNGSSLLFVLRPSLRTETVRTDGRGYGGGENTTPHGMGSFYDPELNPAT
ncbi:hypothetical protein EDB85DRAFT_1894550 [Lactarius pseudohatsudake]|nr:hypothetical protein EDB85DRAFT_1894550 [Lactarius pseudohatsudake]